MVTSFAMMSEYQIHKARALGLKQKSFIKPCADCVTGGHSLGHVHEENTGFDGHWDNTEAKLDNVYFKNMITKNYKPEPVDLVPGPGQ